MSTLHSRSFPHTDRLAAMLAASRRDNTWNSYGGKVLRFMNFCAEYGFTPPPASTNTILAYLAFLSEEDSVHAPSLQPYLTAINQLHEDFQLERPALGPLINRVRAGFAALESDQHGAPIRTTYLPAQVAFDILQLGLTTDDPDLLRDAALVVMCYAFFARGDTGVRTETSAVRIDDRGLHFAEAAKNVPRLRPYLLCLPWPRRNPEVSVHQLVRRFDMYA